MVPYTRGAEVSRPADRVLREARDLVDRGVRDITLLGQNVNAYHGHEGGLAGLIRALAEIDGLARIRFTTSHPNDMDDALIAAYGDCDKLMPYLHLPVQAGSDKILKRMNRQHTADHYLRLIERLRAVRPGLHLSGDFIVGFPEETEADFQATLDLIKAVEYGSAFSFKYSERPGTPAAERAQVPEDQKDDRLQRLQALLKVQQRTYMETMVGHELDILIEKPGRFAGQMVGKTPFMHMVHVESGELSTGSMARAKILSVASNSFSGEILD